MAEIFKLLFREVGRTLSPSLLIQEFLRDDETSPQLECLKKGGLWRLAMDPNKWPSQKKEAGGYNFGTTGFGTGWQRQFLVSEAKGAAGASCPSAGFAAAAAPHARARRDAAAGTCHASAIVQPTG